MAHLAVYVISDLHLSTFAETNKSMEIFGGRWENYTERLKKQWETLIGADDTVVIPGDVSWALSMEEALSDLTFLDALPGKKILLKGNHDLWWTTMKKNTEFCRAHGLSSLSFLYNSAAVCENFVIAGSRGWFSDEETNAKYTNADFDKIRAREIGRMKLSLDAARALCAGEDTEILFFTHFPIAGNGDGEIKKMLSDYGVRRVYFGHLHGNYSLPPAVIENGIVYTLTSADYLSFVPKYINP